MFLGYIHLPVVYMLVILMGASIIKAALIVAYFMHLRFDHPWFRRLFIAGMLLAVFVYVAYLSTLHVWHR